VPINPEYIERITDDEVVFRNYEGKIFRYPLKTTPHKISAAVDSPLLTPAL
jgi:lysine 2,3-aminomutase